MIDLDKLLGRNLELENLPAVDDAGEPLEEPYTGKARIYRQGTSVKVPTGYVCLLTDKLIRNKQYSVTRIFCKPEDLESAMERSDRNGS